MVERLLAKEKVEGSSPFRRSHENTSSKIEEASFFTHATTIYLVVRDYRRIGWTINALNNDTRVLMVFFSYKAAGSFNGRTPAFGAGYSWFESKPRSFVREDLFLHRTVTAEFFAV